MTDFATLGLTPPASPADIKRAYHKLALKYHPDRNPTGAEDFRRVHEAYVRLCERPALPPPSSFLRNFFDYVMRDTIQLTPTLDDLFSQKVFLYNRNASTFPIPLWHHELIYDQFDITCTPRCPNGVTIDADNDLHVLLLIEPAAVLASGEAVVLLDTTKFHIPASELRLVTSQTIYLKGKGIPRIHEDNVFDTSTLSDIIVTVTFI